MNIRALTRGDGVVIGAAVLLFIASFLDISSCDAAASICDRVPSTFSWEISQLGWGAFFLGIAGAALVVVSHAMPQPRKVAGLELAQVGAAFTVAAAWNLLMWIFESTNVGAGLILGTIAALALAGAAVAAPLVPALKAPLVTAPRPQAPQPYGMQPGQQGQPGQPGVPGGYGYPGAQQHQQHQPYGDPHAQHAQHAQPFGGQQGQPQPGAPEPQQAAQPQPAGDFAPFWFAVPVARPLYAEDGSQAPIAELAPGTWYLAVDKRGDALIAQTQDGRRGVLQDTTGIQHG